MFRKLISNLPFNPSLINQVSFYAKRVHSEAAVRRSGFVLVTLAVLLQMFAVIAPPQASLLASDNDIIPGGFTKQSTAVEYCETNRYNFRNILHRFDADCNSIRNNVTTVTIYGKSEGRHLLSLGRNAYQKPGERPITDIYGEDPTRPLYLRYLWSWGENVPYKALKATNTKGKTFYVLYDCGNITINETEQSTPVPPPPAAPPQPDLRIRKTTLSGTPAAGSKVKAGDVLGYRIYFDNVGAGSATNVFIEDSTTTGSFVKGSQGSGAADRYGYLDTPYPGSNGAEPHVYWAYYNLPSGAKNYYVDFKVRVNSGHKDGAQICNRAYIRSNQTTQTWSEKVCHIVDNKRTAVVQTPEETPVSNETRVVINNTTIITTVINNTTIVNTVINNPAIPTKPCDKAQSIEDSVACLEIHKTATNDTQNIIDANGTTAKAGDTITYTLTTRNYGAKDVKDYVIKESLSDVLEYADITELNGGKLDDKKMVSWPALTIKPGEIITKKLTIKIKSPVPNTPSPPGNPGSFDLLLTNVYGDAVNIKLPGSVARIVAHTNTTLPNTGPGTTVAIAVLVTAAAAYFFARSRLMAKELDIVREDYATSGGQ